MNKVFISFTLLAITYSVTAQEQPSKTYALDSVLIQGKEKRNHQRNAVISNAQTTEVLGAYELGRNIPQAMEQSLGIIPGVQVDKRTQFGGQRVVVRGYGNDQKFNNWGVKFYLNGVPMTNADGTTILEDLDFSTVNQVDVIKGPAGTLYGGGVGGVVKFNMLPDEQHGVKISQNTMGGSFNTFGSTTSVNAANDNYAMRFSYGHLQSDGYRPRGNTNKNNYSFLGNFKLSNTQKMMVYASHNDSYQGVDGQISYEDYYAGKDPGNAAYTRRNGHNHFISTRAIVNHQWQVTPNISSNTSIFYHTLDTERAAAGAFEVSEQPSYGARTEWTGKFSWIPDFKTEFNVGAEYLISRPLVSNYRFDGSSLSTPPLQTKPLSKGSYFKYNNYNASFFISNRWKYEPYGLSLVAGLSGNSLGYDRKDLLYFPGLLAKPTKDASIDKDFSLVVTPHVALQKEFGNNHVLTLSYSEGYNAPTAATAYIKGISKTNDNLKPEFANMWDFSAQGTFANQWDYQISLFNIDIKDKLSKLSAKDAQSNPYDYFANTGLQNNKGLELSLGYNYRAPYSFIRAIRPYANLSAYNFKYKDFKTSKGDFSGNKVVGVPSTKYSLGLDFDIKAGFYVRNSFNYISDVYTDFSNTVNVKGFTQYNAKLGYKKNIKNWDLDLFLIGNNLTNQINYTFLFVGNAVGDNDLGNGYPVGTVTDVNPGPSKAYFIGGLNIAYHF
ncbi:TonB-dependent receptor [Ornithobacterium rhinotracheale]|uniref:TonB-dependent receptor n=1 Tax=Ornithobacterium rhinotracheale TaxID=28251 RepID=UPI001FF3500E|nr:TonB-dependent receptor [Ornithobacterium rhinotracheale]MCK0204839.1 TonB-dependent receptor [Ornithobacterium rhinotracheale]